MKSRSIRRILRNNGLSLALLGMFLATYLGGQLWTGMRVYNEERHEHGESPLSLSGYVCSAHFAEATGENWESEFLQMFVYVFITAFLFQKGSAESNDPDKPIREQPVTARSPLAARVGGVARKIYAHSLTLALALLFVLSFGLHAWGSQHLVNDEHRRLGEPLLTMGQHLTSAKFWFESFQNWQSEFLAILSMVVLTIYLREKNSPESKDVAAPHAETGC